MSDIQKVSDFLANAGVFFLSTEDGDQPKCRPLGFQAVMGDKLYFGVGDFKDVYKQMQVNPKVEIVAMYQEGWLRYYGTAVFEPDDKLSEAVLEQAPHLKAIYNDETGYKLAIFHLEKATAEFRSIMNIEESYRF